MSDNEKKHEVRIHINRQAYQSPNPTTGKALYTLGDIGAHYELFREANGNEEDELVPRDNTEVRLIQDEHFYSEKEFKIVVNAREKTVTKPKLSFDEVVALAFDNPPSGPNILFTVAYRKGPPKNPEGTMLEGQIVKIKNKMIFDVTATDKS